MTRRKSKEEALSSGVVKPRKARSPASAKTAAHSRPGKKQEVVSSAADAQFIDALTTDFRSFGASAIAEVREKDPVTYMKLCASVLPKSVIEDADPLDTLTDKELRDRATDLAAKVALGPGADTGGTGEPAKPK
ncbi:MAG: hypothetical protein AAF942_11445 [Pseudomonadota bacterium]